MTQASQSLFMAIGQVVEEAIELHEQSMHGTVGVPPPRRARIRAIPFADVIVPDAQVARAVELLYAGATLAEAAESLNVPVPALELALVDYRSAWRRFLQERAAR